MMTFSDEEVKFLRVVMMAAGVAAAYKINHPDVITVFNNAGKYHKLLERIHPDAARFAEPSLAAALEEQQEMEAQGK